MQTRSAAPCAGAPLRLQLRAAPAPHAAVRSLRRRAAAPLSRPPPRAAASPPPPGEFSNETKLRSEAQAPFRVFRQFLFGAFGVSATIGSGVSFIQFTTGLAGAPSAPPVAQSGQNLAIDGAVLALMVFLWRRDEAARQRQMARISREETLAALRVQLSSNKTVRLAALRGFARVVVVAGSATFVEEAAAAAEPHKEALLARGVLFVPLVTDATRPPPPPPLPAGASAEEKRWRGEPQFVTEWTRWLGDQMGAAGVAAGSGVYVSLRMDGRVRASGVGQPPWALLAASLPPVEGFFGGFLDGMDGRVGSE
jgi:hypothetical protein